MSRRRQLRKLINTQKSILMPVAHDALTAKLIEQVGFHAFSIGGFGVAAASFAKADNGSLTLKDLSPPITHILKASNLPCLVDADTGYGGPSRVAQTIVTYEQAGAAAIFIEDQQWPKRCGHTEKQKLIPINQMQSKIKAALSARKSKDLIIMARTDAISATGSLDAAIRRARAYQQAGAESIFIEAPTTKKQLKAIPKLIPDSILLVNMMEGGKTPLINADDLASWGYHLIAYPITSILSATHGIKNSLQQLKSTGTTNHYFKKHLTPFNEFRSFIGL